MEDPMSLPNDEIDLLQIPPMDLDFLAVDFSSPENFTGDGAGIDFDFTFDDFEFADDLLSEPLLDPPSDVSLDRNPSFEPNLSFHDVRVYDCLNQGLVSSDESNFVEKLSFDSSNSGNVSDRDVSHDRNPIFDQNLSCNGLVSSEESNFGEKLSFDSPNSGNVSDRDRNPNFDQNLSCNGLVSSEETNFGEKLSFDSPNSGSCKSNSVVSHDSGNISDRDVSSNSNNCKIVKVEEIGSSKNSCVSKRKKENEISDDDNDRTSKFKRSSLSNVVECESFNLGSGGGDDDDKKKSRLMRNRESAQLSRQRKKKYVEELEDKIRSMHTTITDLNNRISYVMAENVGLRQQLSGGACPPPPVPGMYPMMGMAPMGYPWMPCPPYMVKPQGSQVPLVPIPRLKPQQPKPASKVNKKVESKKNEGKTKKVASISLLGLLFFFLFFGGLVPMVNVRFGGVREGVNGVQKGTVLLVDNNVNRMGYKGGVGIVDEKFSHGRILQQSNNTSDGVGSIGNSSEPLSASLYVPRNDKMVKIDGNLIIHSVLASERAASSRTDSGVKTTEKTSLAIVGRYPPYPAPSPGRNDGRQPHLDGNPNGRQRAIGSSLSDKSKPATSEGSLQQWFREGLAGPMLSSGMCTEVFQFDVSPTPGSIVPTTFISKTSTDRQNSTSLKNKPRNRRILNKHPIPLSGRTLNFTEKHMPPHKHNDELNNNSSRSSMVVSVLVDPREAGDGDGEGVIRSKTLSRIFVVVLIDSVKYVTYSCMLPFVGSGNHLVTT